MILTLKKVVVGFVVTGWLLILLLIVYYVFGHDPELDPFRKNNQRGRMAKHPNQLDVAFLTGLRINLSYLGLGFSWLQDHQKGGKVETAFNKVRSLRKVLWICKSPTDLRNEMTDYLLHTVCSTHERYTDCHRILHSDKCLLWPFPLLVGISLDDNHLCRVSLNVVNELSTPRLVAFISNHKD